MSTPINIPLKCEGAAQVVNTLKGVRAAMVEIETHRNLHIKMAYDPGNSGALKADHQMRLAMAKAEMKVLEDLKAMRASADSEGGKGGSKGGGGEGALTARGVFNAGAALGLLKGAIDMVVGSLKQFSGFIISDVIKPTLALNTRSVQVANASGGGITSDEVQSKAKAIALKNNANPMDIIDSAGILQDATGDSKLSFQMMDTIATLSKSRGMDPKELSALAGAMHQQGMSAPELSKLLLTQLAQGDQGSVTLAQQARLGGKMPAMAANMAGDYSTRLAITGSLLQTGKKGFGSVDDAAAGLSAFLQESTVHGKSFSRRSMIRGADGVDKVANVGTLIEDALLKTHGNSAAMKAAGYTDQGARFLGAYKDTYSKAFDESKGRGETDQQAQKDAAKTTAEFALSLSTANTTMESEETKRNAVLATSGEAFQSALGQLKDKLLVIMPAVDKILNIFGDTLSQSGADIGGVVNEIVLCFVDLARGAQGLAEWYKDLTTVYGEGDVKRTRRDVGDKTELESQKEKGYWRKNKENFEYVVDSQDPQKMGLFWKKVDKQTVWYNEDDANKFDADKRGKDQAAFDKDLDGRMKRKDYSLFGPHAEPTDAVPEPGWQPGAPADVGLNGGTSDMPKNAAEASAAFASLATVAKDLATSMGELNRNASFGPEE